MTPQEGIARGVTRERVRASQRAGWGWFFLAIATAMSRPANAYRFTTTGTFMPAATLAPVPSVVKLAR